MLDMVQQLTALGRRLAEAGREAREASTAVAGEVGDRMTQTLGAAAGEVVRAAVVGAIVAVIRGNVPRPAYLPFRRMDDLWDDSDSFPPGVSKDAIDSTAKTDSAAESESPAHPRWVSSARLFTTALTVAAGAAASVPGGRLVAAGLGAVAAVAGLAARAGEAPPPA